MSNIVSDDSVHPVIHWDPHNPDEVDNYPEVIRKVREQARLAWSTGHWSAKDSGFWLMTGYDDVRDAGMDWKRYSCALGTVPLQFDLDVFRSGFLDMDPPLHTKVRNVVTPFFLQAAVEVHEDSVANIIEELLDEVVKQDSVDFVDDFAMQLPSRIFFELFLHEDPADIRPMVDLIRSLLKDMAAAAALAPKLLAWCASALESRRQAGRKDDLIGVVAHMGNEPDFQLEERQRVETLMLLVLAGMETTTNAIASVAYTLATEPDVRARMANSSSSEILKAIDEFLRFWSPVPAAGRTLTADTELRGCPMKNGDRVTINWLSANHDPTVYPNPDVLDLDRNASQHLAFGVGYHKCLGMHLAKRELRLTIEALSKLRVFELVPGSEIHFRNGPNRGPICLPVICAR
jgi:cytochrome P450